MIKNYLKELKEKIMNFTEAVKDFFQFMKEDFTDDLKKIWTNRFLMNEETEKEKACEAKANYYDAKENFYGHIFIYLIIPGAICFLILTPVLFQHLKYMIRGIDLTLVTGLFDFYKVMVPATILTLGSSITGYFLSDKYLDKYMKACNELDEIKKEKREEEKKEKEKQKIIEENKKEKVVEKSIDDKKEELIALKDELLSLKQENTDVKAIVLVKRKKDNPNE